METQNVMLEISELVSQCQYEIAENKIKEILVEGGQCFNAWNLLGSIQMNMGKIKDAITSISNALSFCKSAQALSYITLAACYIKNNEYQLAIKMATKALQIKKDDPIALLNLGIAQSKLKIFKDAAVSFKKGLSLDPDNPQLLYGLGVAMTGKSNYKIAIKCFRKAIAKDKNFINAHTNLAVTLCFLGEYQEAERVIERALLLNPNHIDSLNNKGYLLMNMGRYEEAAKISHKMMSVDPANPAHPCGLASVFYAELRLQEAIDLLQQNIEQYPNHFKSKVDLGLIYLAQGDLKEGFKQYEYRLKFLDSFHSFLGTNPVHSPLWTGEKINGKTLLVRCEQGYGDSIQFLRYIPYLQRYNCKIIIELQPHLHCLFKHLGFKLVKAGLEPPPAHDVHIPLMSFPYIFETDLDTIPRPVKIKVPIKPIKNRIGIVWKGNPKHGRNGQRSIDLKLLEPLLQIPEIHYVCLQKDTNPQEIEFLNSHGVEQPKLESFEETSRELAKCERVICVDTAVAHLAASIGIPTWLLITYAPDWRWLLERHDSPWYPSVRLLRQNLVDSWKEPIEELKTLIYNNLKENARTYS